MIEVRALTSFQQDAQTLRKGDTLFVSATTAKELEKANLVERVVAEDVQPEAQDTQPDVKMAEEPKNKAAASPKTK